MNIVHTRYIASFKNYAEALIERRARNEDIIDFTRLLSDRSNMLIAKAIYTENLDILTLKRELHQLEQNYLQIIISAFNEGSL